MMVPIDFHKLAVPMDFTSYKKLFEAKQIMEQLTKDPSADSNFQMTDQPLL